jgi:uncharacterized lipoprotein
VSNAALVIPPAGGAATPAPASEAPAGSAADATASPAASPPGVSAVPGASIAGDGLDLNDTVESAWSRVGLALERSGAASITARDEAAHAYTVATTGQTTTRPGWFKRAITLGRAGNRTTARVQLTVRVSAAGSGSHVSIEGTDDEASRDAARALLETLRQRLS